MIPFQRCFRCWLVLFGSLPQPPSSNIDYAHITTSLGSLIPFGPASNPPLLGSR